MPQSTQCNTLNDSPSIEDSFGGHERIANAIAALVSTEPGGKAIALEGTWGSGKSTIVNLVSNRLAGQVFVFDAWSHLGDPLRRVFLESLIDFIAPVLGNQGKSRWEERRRTIGLPEIRRERTDLAPITSWHAFGASLLLLLAPAAFVVGAWLRAPSPSPALTVGFYISFAVIVLVAVMPFAVLVAQRTRQKAGKDTGTSLLTHRIFGVSPSTSNATPLPSQPTSVEFEREFVSLLDDYFSSSDRRLLVVIDNLDRVSEDHAREAWAALRVFLEMPQTQREWSDRVWVLAPYDRPAIERLWSLDASRDEAEGEGDEAHDSDSPVVPGTPAAFLDKTFQIRFEVPPLLLSRWREYLLRLLQEAFPDHTDSDEQHRVYRVSALVSHEKRRPPTPRHLKLFVNDIGALRRQHGNRFPLHHLAYYAILRRKGYDVRHALISGRVPEAVYQEVLGTEVTASLASLCFNVNNSDDAHDLLLRQPIIGALESGSADQLSSLSKLPGFWEVAEDVLPEWAQSGSARGPMAALAVETSGLRSSSRAEASDIVHRFALALADSVKWYSWDASGGAAATLRLAADPEATRTIVRQLSKIDRDADQIDFAQWAHCVAVALQSAAGIGHGPEIVGDSLLVSTDAAQFVDACAAIAAHRKVEQYWPRLRTAAASSAVLAELAPADSDNLWPPRTEAAFEVLRVSDGAYPWAEFIDAVNETLAGPANAPPQAILQLLIALDRLPASVGHAAAASICELTNAGWLHHYLGECELESDAPVIADLMRRIAMCTTPKSPSPVAGRPAIGNTVLDSILSKPTEHAQIVSAFVASCQTDDGDGVLSRMLASAETEAFVAECFRHMIEQNTVSSHLGGAFITMNHNSLRSLLVDDQYPTVLRACMADRELMNEVRAQPFDSENATLYAEILDHGGATSSEYMGWLDAALQSVSIEAWRNALESSTPVVSLLLSYANARPDFRLGVPLRDAVEQILLGVLRRSTSVATPLPQWILAVRVIDSGGRRAIARNLLDAANPTEDLDWPRVLELYGDDLFDRATTGPPQDFLRRVLSPLIRTADTRSTGWLARLLNARSPILDAASSDERKDLEGRVLALLRLDGDNEVDTSVIDIAEALGLASRARRTEEQDG